ncbi:MAG: C1 family peptidase [Anaerolineales bacterium]|jgi:C1A family cysteine protease
MDEITFRPGWLKDKPDPRDVSFAPPPEVIAAKRDEVDLRAKCPPIYDQKRLGYCFSFATLSVVEFDRMAQGLPDFQSSALFLGYNVHVMEHTVGEDAGGSIRDSIKSLARMGDCQSAQWPYDVEKYSIKPPKRCYRSALKYKIVAYHRIGNDRINPIDLMEACLSLGKIIVFGIKVFPSFPMKTKTGAIPMPQPGEMDEGGHAINLVGYKHSAKFGRIRNEWNTTWGDAGYGTIPYDYLEDPALSSDFWTITLTK